MWYVIRLDHGFYSVRHGYMGGAVERDNATLFSHYDALQRSADIPGSSVEPL